MATSEQEENLRRAIEEIADGRGLKSCGLSVHDLQSGFRFSLNGDLLFHAASTIKVAILLALFKGIEDGRIRANDPLHVRNRFLSAIDRVPFRLDSEADGYPQLYRLLGRTARVSALAESMIIWSSNLATNLLLDRMGVEYATSGNRRSHLRKRPHPRRGERLPNIPPEGQSRTARNAETCRAVASPQCGARRVSCAAGQLGNE